MTKPFSSVQAAVDAVQRGEVVIVLDAEDRENEGDYICAAELVTPEDDQLHAGWSWAAVLSRVAKCLRAARATSYCGDQ